MHLDPQWNTPPDGDFARYVEQLSARAALPRHAPREGEHGLDVGMTPSSPPHGAAPAVAARNALLSNGEVARQGAGGTLGQQLIDFALRSLRNWAEARVARPQTPSPSPFRKRDS